MKVRDVRTTIVTVPLVEPERWRSGELWGLTNLIVEVETDDGIIGFGEAPGSPSIGIVAEIARELAKLLVGHDAGDISGFLDRCVQAGSGHYATACNTAIGALEVALWDVLGRSLGVPVWQLFGGLTQPSAPFWWYVTPLERTEELVREHAARGVAHGFETIYLKVGFDLEVDLRLAQAIRDELGPGPRLRVDANEAWSRVEALRMLPAYAELGVDFVEEPIDAADIEGMVMLRAASPVPIGANQSAWLPRDAWRIIRAQAADVIVSDQFQTGGIGALRDLAAVCHAANISLTRHAFGDLGITTAAGLQVLGASHPVDLAHQQYVQIAEHQLIQDPFVFEGGGRLSVPTGPGLGVELDREALAHYADLYERYGESPQYGGAGAPVQIPASERLGRSQAFP
jgi:glucarate dehydratase